MSSELGKIAYESCPDHGPFKPQWEHLQPHWRDYWNAIAAAVAEACSKKLVFGDIHEAPLDSELLANVDASDVEALTRLHCAATLRTT